MFSFWNRINSKTLNSATTVTPICDGHILQIIVQSIHSVSICRLPPVTLIRRTYNFITKFGNLVTDNVLKLFCVRSVVCCCLFFCCFILHDLCRIYFLCLIFDAITGWWTNIHILICGLTRCGRNVHGPFHEKVTFAVHLNFEPLRIEHCRSHAVCLPLSGLVICAFFLCFREFACHYQSMDAIACLEKFVYETYNLSSGMSNLTRSFLSYSLPKNLVFIAS